MRMAGPRRSMRAIALRTVATIIYWGVLFEFGSESGLYRFREGLHCLRSFTVDYDNLITTDAATAHNSEGVLFVSEGDVVVMVEEALVIGCFTHIEEVFHTACHYTQS